MRLLTVGSSTRHLAQSASKFAEIVSIDEFCDLDLQSYVDKCLKAPEMDEDVISRLIEGIDFDYVLSTTHFIPNTLDVLGNSVEKMRLAGNKFLFAEYCETKGFPHPETSLTPSKKTPLEKPVIGGGGVRNRYSVKKRPGKIYQEIIEGKVFSVSFISSGSEAKALSVNRSLSDIHVCDPPNPFAYCGNFTPTSNFPDKIIEIGREIVVDYRLKGSVGIDFLVEEPKNRIIPLEINPRIQASLDTVEAVKDTSVTKQHVDVCLDEKIESGRSLSLKEKRGNKNGKEKEYACKLVLYAKEKFDPPDLSGFRCRDIPVPGRVIEKGEPVTTILRKAETAEKAFNKALNAVKEIKEAINID